MNVLFLTTEVGGRGGVQYAGRLVLRALRDCAGGRLAVVSVRDRGAALQDLVPPGTRVGGGGRLRAGLAALAEWQRDDWDLVLLGHLNLAGLVALANRRRRLPVLALVYGLEAWGPISPLRRRGLIRADRLLYISESSRARSEAANPWLAELPAAVCYLGLLPDESPVPNGTAARTPDGPFALMIGRMARAESYKGHEEMIRVWPAVERARPGLCLVVIGDGDDRARLEGLARGLGANVHFLGGVDDATRDACLRICRCFCLPSRGEGFGLVYLEAMRCGKPVLAGSLDAGREVVVDGVTGRAVDPTDPDELLQGILDVSGDRAEEFGLAGRRRFDESFGYGRFLERFSRHVHEVAGRVTAGR